MPQIQVNDEIALVKNRQVQHVLSCSGSHAVFPLIARVSSQVQCSNSRPSVQLFGCNIGHSHNVYLCRCQGEILQAAVCSLLACLQDRTMKFQTCRSTCQHLRLHPSSIHVGAPAHCPGVCHGQAPGSPPRLCMALRQGRVKCQTRLSSCALSRACAMA